ncbi:hypothetical protein MBLNU230_g4973t1 [Neophaeotheca triangularis]
MEATEQPNEALRQLQSEDQAQLLDVVDKLRSINLLHDGLDLPQLLVCGDQSAGKSSFCQTIQNFSVSIKPAPTRSLEEKEHLSSFHSEDLATPEDFPSIIESAAAHMARLSGSGAFYHDVLRAEICGPNQPHLMLVD